MTSGAVVSTRPPPPRVAAERHSRDASLFTRHSSRLRVLYPPPGCPPANPTMDHSRDYGPLSSIAAAEYLLLAEVAPVAELRETSLPRLSKRTAALAWCVLVRRDAQLRTPFQEFGTQNPISPERAREQGARPGARPGPLSEKAARAPRAASNEPMRVPPEHGEGPGIHHGVETMASHSCALPSPRSQRRRRTSTPSADSVPRRPSSQNHPKVHASMAGPTDKLRESYVDTERGSDPQPHRPREAIFERIRECSIRFGCDQHHPPDADAAQISDYDFLRCSASDTSMLDRMVAPAQPPLLPAPLYFYNMGARITNHQQMSPGHQWAKV
ncbi:hypothetical protein HPB47_012441 [Ixodes persulcatus]|uniref:Uncharacterized protein n=1 Tax=Ixodes persulcatus TaxID=34615 RepID=A0AC60NTI4_IXOPE|nr:hypothetical protein HPB47_012441 [Ixodes persulcatus]